MATITIEDIHYCVSMLGLPEDDAENIMALVLSKPPRRKEDLPDYVADMLDKIFNNNHNNNNNKKKKMQLNYDYSIFPLLRLPSHIISNIFSFLTIEDLCLVSKINTFFNNKIKQEGFLLYFPQHANSSNFQRCHFDNLRILKGTANIELQQSIPKFKTLESFYVTSIGRTANNVPNLSFKLDLNWEFRFTLRKLYLYGKYGMIEDSWFKNISTFSNLEVLRVGGCTKITVATISHISKLTRLKDLYIGSITYSILPREEFIKLNDLLPLLPKLCYLEPIVNRHTPIISYSIATNSSITNNNVQNVYIAKVL